MPARLLVDIIKCVHISDAETPPSKKGKQNKVRKMIAIHAPLSLEELSFAANINKSISFARREFQKWVRGNFSRLT